MTTTASESPLRAALYARLLPEDRASVADKLAALRAIAADRGWAVVAEFADGGSAGAQEMPTARPGLRDSLESARHGEIDLLLLHTLADLSRSFYITLDLLEQLGRHDVGLLVAAEPHLDLSDPSSSQFASTLTAIHDAYLDRAKAQGAAREPSGTLQAFYSPTSIPFGYLPAEELGEPPRVDPAAAPAVRQAFQTYATGQESYQSVAELLNKAGHRTGSGGEFSKDAVFVMLRNPFYAGLITYRPGLAESSLHEGEERTVKGQHEPLVSSELFQAVQDARTRRHTSPRTYQTAFRNYLLNGLLSCDHCGRTLRAQAGRSNRYYREASDRRGVRDCPASQVGVRADVIEAQLGAVVRQLSLPTDWRAELQTLLHGELEATKASRVRLEAELRRAQDLHIRGEFGDDLSVYSAATDWIKGELAALPPADLDAQDIEEAAEALEMLARVWDNADLDERRELLFTLFQDVRADPLMERITQLVPYPAYVPLLRLVGGLIESDSGVFVVAFPPEEGSEHFPDRVIQLPDPLPDPADFPAGFSVLLPKLPSRRRSDPRLSHLLQRRRKAGLDSGLVLERPHPLAPATRLDPRQWPDYELHREQFSLDPPAIPAGDDELAVLITPFVFALAPDHRERLVREAARVLGPEGYWLLTEPDPAAMPGYWLYQLFPAARQFDLDRHLSAVGLLRLMQVYGFEPSLERHARQQRTLVSVVVDWVGQRQFFPQLATLTDADYQSRLEELGGKPEGQLLSQVAVMSGVVHIPHR